MHWLTGYLRVRFLFSLICAGCELKMEFRKKPMEIAGLRLNFRQEKKNRVLSASHTPPRGGKKPLKSVKRRDVNVQCEHQDAWNERK